jgi:hypothetical protein
MNAAAGLSENATKESRARHTMRAR